MPSGKVRRCWLKKTEESREGEVLKKPEERSACFFPGRVRSNMSALSAEEVVLPRRRPLQVL